MANTCDFALPDFFGESRDWYDIPGHLSNFAKWMVDFFSWLPQFIWDCFLRGLAAVIEVLPSPVSNLDLSAAAGVLSGAGYVAGLVHLQFGVGIIFAAATAKFLLRRIPLVG